MALVETKKIGSTRIEIYDDYVVDKAEVPKILRRIADMALPALQRTASEEVLQQEAL